MRDCPLNFPEPSKKLYSTFMNQTKPLKLYKAYLRDTLSGSIDVVEVAGRTKKDAIAAADEARRPTEFLLSLFIVK